MRRPPSWLVIAGILVALVGVAWVTNDESAADDTAAAEAALAEAPGVAISEAPTGPIITPERRAIARMSMRGLAVTNGGGRLPLVALTFDDGPGPLTMEFLETLERLDVPATFYVQGGLLNGHRSELEAMVAGGHEVGVHGWNHLDLTDAHGADFEREVFEVQHELRDLTGIDPATMRPPYGAIDDRVLRDLRPSRMMAVLWDIDTNDWRGGTAKQIADHVLGNASPGSIVLIHEGPETRAPTLRALPVMVRGLRARGFEFVTVTDLLVRDPPAALRDDPIPDGDGVSTDGSEVSAPEPDPSSSPSETAPRE